jgi:hypothetical protein
MTDNKKGYYLEEKIEGQKFVKLTYLGATKEKAEDKLKKQGWRDYDIFNMAYEGRIFYTERSILNDR